MYLLSKRINLLIIIVEKVRARIKIIENHDS